jgi:hypothetical protein
LFLAFLPRQQSHSITRYAFLPRLFAMSCASIAPACSVPSPSRRLRITAAIVDDTAPADLTVTGLAKALPYSWAEQERAISRNE